MTQNSKDILKSFISCAAFLSSVVIGFIALFIPPEGEIDSSILWFTAQMLLFVSALLGVNLSLDSIGMKGVTNVTKIVNNDTVDETDVTSDEIQNIVEPLNSPHSEIKVGRR